MTKEQRKAKLAAFEQKVSKWNEDGRKILLKELNALKAHTQKEMDILEDRLKINRIGWEHDWTKLQMEHSMLTSMSLNIPRMIESLQKAKEIVKWLSNTSTEMQERQQMSTMNLETPNPQDIGQIKAFAQLNHELAAMHEKFHGRDEHSK